MQRRNFLIGVAGTAIGGSALVGSGAFTSVEADRSVTVQTADDNDAYLGLEAARTGIVDSDGDSGQLTLDLGNGDGTPNGGEGFNENAVTEIDGVFRIENQGTERVGLTINNHLDSVAFELQNDELNSGSHTLVDVTVNTRDYSPENHTGTVTITADVDDVDS